jgi:hypothetical protein
MGQLWAHRAYWPQLSPFASAWRVLFLFTCREGFALSVMNEDAAYYYDDGMLWSESLFSWHTTIVVRWHGPVVALGYPYWRRGKNR